MSLARVRAAHRSESPQLRAVARSRAVLVGLVVGVPLSAIFLWLALRDADLDRVWAALTAADARYVAAAVLVFGAVYSGQAVRWRVIARTPEVSTVRFGEMVVSGIAVNNVLPGRVGDLFRARWLQRDARIAGGRALATVVVDRAFDVLALVLLLAASVPLVASPAWLVRIAAGGLALLGLIVLGLTGARVYTSRRARGRRAHRGLVRRLVRDTLEGLADPIGRRRGAGLLGLSLAVWGMWALAAWLVARAVSIELMPVEAVFVTGAINLGVAIPSSPGFIGTYQWLGVSTLALLGVPTEEALAFAILMHATWYVPTILAGGTLLVVRAVAAVRTLSPRRSTLGDRRDA